MPDEALNTVLPPEQLKPVELIVSDDHGPEPPPDWNEDEETV